MTGESDRIAGVLVGVAAGDALGAGYEFATPPDAVDMIGGGLGAWAPGEWTDDTQQTICLARVAATGGFDFTLIGQHLLDWYASGPRDLGISTAAVLGATGSATSLPVVARRYFEDHPNGAAGNGSLMRTAPVALSALGDDRTIVQRAWGVSQLTHGDPLAAEACALWSIAIDRAVREQRLDGVRDGLSSLPSRRSAFWSDRLDEAETRPPAEFAPNGYVVTALQAAHAAITQTPVPADRPAGHHLQDALEAAVCIGHDTDTVAAIAGAVLGGRWGSSAVPFRWRRRLHGWPGMRTTDLVRLAVLSGRRGQSDDLGWPATPRLLTRYAHRDPQRPICREVPAEPGLLVGNVAGLVDAVQHVDAVVSLCRMGHADVPARIEHHEIPLTDTAHESDDPNLSFVLEDTVEALTTLRDEGKTVFLHCVGGRSRTPTVAALYLARRLRVSGGQALSLVADVLDHDPHNERFARVLADVNGR